MDTVSCESCGKSKAPLNCGHCHKRICKSCAHFLEDGSFSFLPKVPSELTHTTYCEPCFYEQVAPEQTKYEAAMEQAKEILIFFKQQSKETRLIERSEDPIEVLDCADRDETIMRLAFLASRKGFNAVIDIELKPKKVRDNAYQTCVWHAVGIPAQVIDRKLIKDKSLRHYPN